MQQPNSKKFYINILQIGLLFQIHNPVLLAQPLISKSPKFKIKQAKDTVFKPITKKLKTKIKFFKTINVSTSFYKTRNNLLTRNYETKNGYERCS